MSQSVLGASPRVLSFNLVPVFVVADYCQESVLGALSY